MSWRGVTGLRTALVALLGGGITAAILAMLAFGNRVRVVERMEDGTATLHDARRADDLVRSAAILILAVFLATAIVWVVWQWRAAKNVEAYAGARIRFSPSWSIWGWIIPFASLVIPVLIMQDLWRASAPTDRSGVGNTRRGSALIGFWWAAFVIASFAGRGIGFNDRSTLSGLRSADRAAVVSGGLLIVAAILAIFVVVQLSDRLEALRAAGPRVTRVPMGPPPGWYTDPLARFQFRYWDGQQWTARASTGGTESFDPIDPGVLPNAYPTR